MAESIQNLEYADYASWIELSRSAVAKNITYRMLIDSHIQLGRSLKAMLMGMVLEILDCVHSYVDILFVISPIDAFKIRKHEKDNELLQSG